MTGSDLNEDDEGAAQTTGDEDIKNEDVLFNLSQFTGETKNINGCPFFNKEITDPEGKNIT